MKTILAAAMLLMASFATHAQVVSLDIFNRTPCTVYFSLTGSTSGSCLINYHGYLSLAPFSSYSFPNPTAVPGGMVCGGCTPSILGTTDNFVHMRLYEADLTSGCSTVSPGENVSDACLGLTAPATLTLQNSGSCTPCMFGATVQWVPTGPTSAQININ